MGACFYFLLTSLALPLTATCLCSVASPPPYIFKSTQSHSGPRNKHRQKAAEAPRLSAPPIYSPAQVQCISITSFITVLLEYLCSRRVNRDQMQMRFLLVAPAHTPCFAPAVIVTCHRRGAGNLQMRRLISRLAARRQLFAPPGLFLYHQPVIALSSEQRSSGHVSLSLALPGTCLHSDRRRSGAFCGGCIHVW